MTMSASYFDLLKYAATGQASPSMTGFDKLKALAMAMSGTKKPAMNDYAAIAKIVRAGQAEQFFTIGEQIICTYTFTDGTEFDMPFDIVDFGTKALENGTVVPAMIIQSHWATIETIDFDAAETGRPAEEDYGGQIRQSGWNRWIKSAYRQWLNSAAEEGNWWTAQNDYDEPPVALEHYKGFLCGLPAGFLAMLKPVKIETVRNYRDPDSAKYASTYEYDTTYDTFWIPSQEEEYIEPNEPNHREGTAWQYWKDALAEEAAEKGELLPQKTYESSSKTHELLARRRFGMENHTKAVSVRLRSCYRTTSNSIRWIHTKGYISSQYGASSKLRCTPVCAIC